MKTVGSTLKDAREAKGLTLLDVERATRIRQKFLEAIEKDEFRTLPSPAYAKGFVRNYAAFLGLSTEQIMAFFRRQMTETPRASLLPKGVADPLNAPFFQLTPGRFLGLLIAALLVVFFVYLGSQYRRLSQPPLLTVTSPQDQSVVTEKRAVVEGQTDSDATVMINGTSTIVRDDGRFYEQVPLEAGVNKITIVATSKFGKVASVVREVGYQQ